MLTSTPSTAAASLPANFSALPVCDAHSTNGPVGRTATGSMVPTVSVREYRPASTPSTHNRTAGRTGAQPGSTGTPVGRSGRPVKNPAR